MEKSMKEKVVQEALTFDDVSLLPNYSEILPKDVKLNTHLTREIALNIPLISAAMDTVTEARLAIAIAEEGGIGILHKNMTVEEQASQVRKVKKFESGVVIDPITVTPDTNIRELLSLIKMHGISGMPVVQDQQLVGIITNRDIRFETNLEQSVANLMTPKEKLVTVPEGASKEEVITVLRKNRVEKVLVVNDTFQLRGLITVKDILRAEEKTNACLDTAGRLRVGAAVGVSVGTDERVEALVKAEVDVLVVDTAHGYSKGVLDRVRWIKQHYPDLQLIAGNIVSADAALALVKTGVDAVKVGIGPGSICTTRMVSGVGVPQITAVYNVAQALKDENVPVIADGGIRFSGDLNKAIAAGAWSIMIGGLFAGTEEAPGEIEFYQGRSYKSYRGMGSIGAMSQKQGSSDRYFQESLQKDKLVPEGIEGRVPYKGPLAAVIYQLLGGMRAGLGYTGCASVEEMRSKARFISITPAGIQESHVHDVMITKEAPNYWREG
jgi:IMP dehydrogenase